MSFSLAIRRLTLLSTPPCNRFASCWAVQLPKCAGPGLRLARFTQHTPSISRYPSRNSSSSSTRWKQRQGQDLQAKEAKLAGLRSRAAFKLLEINAQYGIFKRGDTVVDLGYAPGSWSQVAIARVGATGRVVGIDVLPAAPPKGVSTLQGDFLSPHIQAEMRNFVRDPQRGRPRLTGPASNLQPEVVEVVEEGTEAQQEETESLAGRKATGRQTKKATSRDQKQVELDLAEGRVVDVVLSDMMMNTSGIAFRDHAGSMDLCFAALTFAYDTLVTGGHFVCKFYDGQESLALEKRLKKLFGAVHRVKPDSSRKESKEAYFVALRRKADAPREQVLGDGG